MILCILMYLLIDEILVPLKYQEVFLHHLPKFKNLYLKVPGVTSATYLKTTLEAFEEPRAREILGSGAKHLIISINPKNSYLLMIVFKSRKFFEAYHDNTALSKTIHRKIAFYFDGKQLTIRAALHGEKIDGKNY